MQEASEKAKHITVGILAHVDAGKTTLSEALLYEAGAIDRIGRVDKKDTHLDTGSVERARGITIFSKQAQLSVNGTEMTLLDTPGHIDFSCEAERALSVQDYAILVISAPEGVQAHTKTLWNLLSARHIPVFLFINKIDITALNRNDVFRSVREQLSPRCVNFSQSEEASLWEDAASQDETLMHEYFETGKICDSSLAEAIQKRGIFPCFFGSALKMIGVRPFLESLSRFTPDLYPDDLPFGAKVFKIARDPSGVRLSYLKITGGTLHPKDTITLHLPDGSTQQEKIEEIRIYSADKFKSVKSAIPGTVIAIPGLQHTFAGMGLGMESDDGSALAPVLDYRLEFPDCDDVHGAYLKILPLAEEEPSLGLCYDDKLKEVRVHLMGDIQAEVLTALIEERFGIQVRFGEGKILYRETIAAPVMGAGHFEPLRHYAEVRLLLEPLPEGSGMVYTSDCPTDYLSLNYQRLILSHLEERGHRGVLTGSPLTDIKVTLLIGRAHIKHTVGGDFREATFRALRQGLMKAESVLLEPTFDFRMELPRDCLGRALTDLAAMYADVESPEFCGETAVIHGNCPVFTMRSYAKELRAYTHGEGKMILSVGNYIPCHNAEEIRQSIGYNPELDMRHTANSVFCKNGAGYVVPWQEADAFMHTPDPAKPPEESIDEETKIGGGKVSSYRSGIAEDKELMRLFEMTYGKIKPRKIAEKVENAAPEQKRSVSHKPKKSGEEYLIVDGYNFIFAWDELRNYAGGELTFARDFLIRILSNYSAFRKCRVILVFDAYRRKGGSGGVENIGGITVVYTKEAQTADAYIEKVTHDIAPIHTVRVVTSDLAEQYVVLGNGALRVSTKEFMQEIQSTSLAIREIIDSLPHIPKP